MGRLDATMIQDVEIRQKLWGLSIGLLSLRDFEQWIGPASRSMHRDSAPEAVKMVSEIHHLFAAYDRGYIGDDKLRRELLALLNEPIVLAASVRIGPNSISPIELPRAAAANPVQLPETAIALPA